MSDEAEQEEQAEQAAEQQRVIIDLLKTHGGGDYDAILAALRQELASRGVAEPSPFWVEMVAGEIANDRMYVVDNGLIPQEAFSNPAAERARRRLREEHDLPLDEPVTDAGRAAERREGTGA